MGKRLGQSELLDEIAIERDKLIQIIEPLSAKEIGKRGRNEAGWAIKDVLSHLLDWEKCCNQWYQAGKNGETPILPDPDFKWSQIRELNDRIYRSYKQKSVSQIQKLFDNVHRLSLQNISKMSNEELTTIGYYEWTGKSWTLSDYFRANTASHYRWASKKIKKWLKEEHKKSNQ